GLMLIAGAFAADVDYRQSVLDSREWLTVVDDVPHAELAGFYNGNDAFVRSFAHESYGLSRIEAIWCGVPVVATNMGETRGMLTYEFDDVVQLSELLRNVLEGEIDLDVGNWAAVFREE